MLYEYLKRRAIKFRESILMDEKLHITYEEMFEMAEGLGKTLKHYKYGILCESELYTAIALLACFYTKSTGILLSSRYGEKHNQKIIKDMSISHLITEKGVKVIAKPEQEPEELSDVALIMCTSGTTGSPKGAMITYENLLTNLKDIDQYFKIESIDKILIARPLYHCAVLTGEFLISLIKGIDIVFLNSPFNPVAVLKAIRQYNITVFCGTPTIFYYFCGVLERKARPLSLKVAVVSGESMTERVAKRLQQTLSFVNIYHVYGLTEASPRVSFLSPQLFAKNPLSVGIPLKSLQVKIKNGELLVAGRSIMKGYYNNPEATREVVKDGWLYTGDLAEIDTKGMITIKARKDNMIIRAGMNIYPQEIEETLKKVDQILDVMVYGVRDIMVGEKIYLKVVTNVLSKREIFAYCCSLLPSYQLPDDIEIVDKIAKSISGKIVRRGSIDERES